MESICIVYTGQWIRGEYMYSLHWAVDTWRVVVVVVVASNDEGRMEAFGAVQN